jgi:hypothetical protein
MYYAMRQNLLTKTCEFDILILPTDRSVGYLDDA